MANIIEIADALKTFCAGYSDTQEVKLYPAERLGDQENGLVCIIKPNDISNIMQARNGGELVYEFEVGFLKWITDDAAGQTILTINVESFIKDAVGQTLTLTNESEYRYVIRAVMPSVFYSQTTYNRRKQFASILKVEVFDSESA